MRGRKRKLQERREAEDRTLAAWWAEKYDKGQQVEDAARASIARIIGAMIAEGASLEEACAVLENRVPNDGIRRVGHVKMEALRVLHSVYGPGPDITGFLAELEQ